MTKTKFNEVVAATRQFVAESRTLIGKDVIEKVPLFKSLSALHRAKLLDAMQSASFSAGAYICRQGSIGNAFYIITEGTCRVTLNAEDFTEKEVNTMYAGDFFGKNKEKRHRLMDGQNDSTIRF
jgi:signal-transduction protein with cAMP-binding, CBS, and nucleotidyltransferase domain